MKSGGRRKVAGRVISISLNHAGRGRFSGSNPAWLMEQNERSPGARFGPREAHLGAPSSRQARSPLMRSWRAQVHHRCPGWGIFISLPGFQGALLCHLNPATFHCYYGTFRGRRRGRVGFGIGGGQCKCDIC